MKSKCIIAFVLVIGVLLGVSCSEPIRKSIKIVRTKGVSNVFNLSKSHTHFGSVCLEDTSSAFTTENGDLLLVPSGEMSSQIVFQYSPSLGEVINFRSDSLQPGAAFLNGSIYSLELGDSISWQWIKNQNKANFSELHSISLSLPLTEQEMKTLEEIAGVRNNVNLMIEAGNDAKQLEKILSLFKPQWLYISVNDSWSISDSMLLNLSLVNTLGMDAGPEVPAYIDQLYRLINLKSLILECDPKKAAEINFSKFEKLTSLSVTNSSVRSSIAIRLPKTLRSLYFVKCDSLTNISNLSLYPKLETLGFSGCSGLKDIRAIQGMKNLSWLSCPPGIEQAQFDSLIPSLPSLQVLELIDCDSLKNLDVLNNLKGLKSLTLASRNIQVSSLFELKNLDLLVIKPDTGIIGERGMKELKAQLPETIVVPGGGFCLGSGWILLFIPLVLTGLFIFRKRQAQS